MFGKSAFSMRDNNRFQALRNLTPVEAVKAWLEGDFGMGDEAALIHAIRQDSRIKGSDNAIIDFMADAMLEETIDAQECLDRLAEQ